MSAGRWNGWYADIDEPEPYADTITYQLGVEWLAPCALIEDWGCGKGWLRTLVEPERYRGVDGSRTPFADLIVDLADYRSSVPGIFMRHVIEHDYRWRTILANALASCERLFLVIFTPIVETTLLYSWDDDPDVPVIAFAMSDLAEVLGDRPYTVELLDTDAVYGSETVFRIG